MAARGCVDREGFAILPDLLSYPETVQFAKELHESVKYRSRAGVRHALRYACVSALANDTRLLGIAREHLGDSAFPFRATLFDKSIEANWLVVWHQDTALPLRHRQDREGWGPWSVKQGVIYAHAPAKALEQVLALRVHLDDSKLDNGPLRILPGSHTLGVLSDDAIHRLAAQISPVDCLVPQGGVLALRPLLVHASSKSHTGSSRRVLHIEYAVSAAIWDGLELAVA